VSSNRRITTLKLVEGWANSWPSPVPRRSAFLDVRAGFEELAQGDFAMFILDSIWLQLAMDRFLMCGVVRPVICFGLALGNVCRWAVVIRPMAP